MDKQFLKDWHIPPNQIQTEKNQTTIDSLVKQEKIEKICLLKIDIEGVKISELKRADTIPRQKRIKNLIV